VRGFYSVSSASLDFQNWPAGLRLPRYPIPVARIGRLAVDKREQGTGLGATLLRHAMRLSRSLAQQIGIYAVVVDAKSDAAASFYQRFGFLPFPASARQLFVTMDVIRRAVESGQTPH
jgi:GNAT superfamily N-acetyltransferase